MTKLLIEAWTEEFSVGQRLIRGSSFTCCWTRSLISVCRGKLNRNILQKQKGFNVEEQQKCWNFFKELLILSLTQQHVWIKSALKSFELMTVWRPVFHTCELSGSDLRPVIISHHQGYRPLIMSQFPFLHAALVTFVVSFSFLPSCAPTATPPPAADSPALLCSSYCTLITAFGMFVCSQYHSKTAAPIHTKFAWKMAGDPEITWLHFCHNWFKVRGQVFMRNAIIQQRWGRIHTKFSPQLQLLKILDKLESWWPWPLQQDLWVISVIQCLETDTLS